MSTAALSWPLAPRVTRATRTFPSVSLPTRGVPIEVNLVAQLSPGTGTRLFHDALARQRQHGRFVDELDEPSAKLGGCDFAKGDATALYTFSVGPGGHPFHRHAGHRVFTAVSGSAGAQLRFSTATPAELASDAASFVRALHHVNVPPDCLFTVRFSGEHWHQFAPLGQGSGHPAFFALSTHTNELGGDLSDALRQQVLADRADIPTLTELLPDAVLALLQGTPADARQVPTTERSLVGRAGTWAEVACRRYRSWMGHAKAAWGRSDARLGAVRESSDRDANQDAHHDALAADSLLHAQLMDRRVHHQDSFTLGVASSRLPAGDAAALLAGLLDAFLAHRHAGVSRAMAVRNWIVRPLALRRSPLACPVSSLLADSAPAVFAGHPVLAWRVADDGRSAQVVLGADDRHLVFRSSVEVRCAADGEVRFTLATRVACGNAFGRLYMGLISRAHRHYIVPRLLGVAVDALAVPAAAGARTAPVAA